MLAKFSTLSSLFNLFNYLWGDQWKHTTNTGCLDNSLTLYTPFPFRDYTFAELSFRFLSFHSLTHSVTHSLTHALTHSLTHSLDEVVIDSSGGLINTPPRGMSKMYNVSLRTQMPPVAQLSQLSSVLGRLDKHVALSRIS